MDELRAAKLWVMTYAAVVTLMAIAALSLVSPSEVCEWPAVSAELVVAAGMCVLLTDAFFMNAVTVPFTGEQTREQTNLAHVVAILHVFSGGDGTLASCRKLD